MIPMFIVSLALVLQVVAAPPALAVSQPECEAWLCLPGGFPPSECSPAQAAVMARLAAFKPALPSWASCAAQFGWDAANLAHTDRWYDECPHGGSPDRRGRAATTCSGTDLNGCDFSYSAQKKVRVTVAVDGQTNFAPNHTHRQTVAGAGSRTVDQGSCDTEEGSGYCPAGQTCTFVGPPASPAMGGAGAVGVGVGVGVGN